MSTACPHPQSQLKMGREFHGYKQVSFTQRFHQRKHRVGTLIWLLVNDRTLLWCCVCMGGVFPLLLGLLRAFSVPFEIREQQQSQHCPSSSSPGAGQCRGPCGDLARVPRAARASHAPQGQQQHPEHPQLSQAAPLLLCTSCLFPKVKKRKEKKKAGCLTSQARRATELLSNPSLLFYY